MNLIEKARLFAKEKHQNHFDDDGKSYFHAHICQVVAILLQASQDEHTICAAYLHDTIEDTDTTYDELYMEFGEEIADLVYEMTHEGTNDDKGYYFPRLHSHKAIMIKFADRLSNLSRMSGWNEKRQSQYLKKSKFWKDYV